MIVPITCRSRDASFCVGAQEEAIAKYRKPETMNTDSLGQPIHRRRLDHDFDQGRHQNLYGWSGPLSRQHLHLTPVAIPQSGGRLPAKNHGGFQAKRIINNWIEFYNSEHPHTALDMRTPDSHTLAKRRHEKWHEHTPDAS